MIAGVLAFGVVPVAAQNVVLGGIDLNDYCLSNRGGDTYAELTRPQVGPDAAKNNWVCRTESLSLFETIDMVAACQWQYENGSVTAVARSLDDAYSWQCELDPTLPPTPAPLRLKGPEKEAVPVPGVAVCNNLVVTVEISKGQIPTDGDDVIRGTAGDDVIDALGGNDVICSLQGDDTIIAGDGFDKVFAGAGNDTIDGGDGNDLLIGGKGNDTISAGKGNDRLQGGDGTDLLYGNGGMDRITGGNGNDNIHGGSHDDQLFGNLGRDQIFGEGGNDVLRGGAWKDVMNGGVGNGDRCTLTDPGGLVETRIDCERGVFGVINQNSPDTVPETVLGPTLRIGELTAVGGGALRWGVGSTNGAASLNGEPFSIIQTTPGQQLILGFDTVSVVSNVFRSGATIGSDDEVFLEYAIPNGVDPKSVILMRRANENSPWYIHPFRVEGRSLFADIDSFSDYVVGQPDRNKLDKSVNDYVAIATGYRAIEPLCTDDGGKFIREFNYTPTKPSDPHAFVCNVNGDDPNRAYMRITNNRASMLLLIAPDSYGMDRPTSISPTFLAAAGLDGISYSGPYDGGLDSLAVAGGETVVVSFDVRNIPQNSFIEFMYSNAHGYVDAIATVGTFGLNKAVKGIGVGAEKTVEAADNLRTALDEGEKLRHPATDDTAACIERSARVGMSDDQFTKAVRDCMNAHLYENAAGELTTLIDLAPVPTQAIREFLEPESLSINPHRIEIEPGRFENSDDILAQVDELGLPDCAKDPRLGDEVQAALTDGAPMVTAYQGPDLRQQNRGNLTEGTLVLTLPESGRWDAANQTYFIAAVFGDRTCGWIRGAQLRVGDYLMFRATHRDVIERLENGSNVNRTITDQNVLIDDTAEGFVFAGFEPVTDAQRQGIEEAFRRVGMLKINAGPIEFQMVDQSNPFNVLLPEYRDCSQGDVTIVCLINLRKNGVTIAQLQLYFEASGSIIGGVSSAQYCRPRC